MDVTQAKHKATTDWTGLQHVGLTLEWDHVNRTVDASVLGCVKSALQRLHCPPPTRPQRALHKHNKLVCSHKEPQGATKEDTLDPLPSAKAMHAQEVVGALPFCGRAVNDTVLAALSSLVTSQAQAMRETAKGVAQLLNHAATHPDAVVHFWVSDMVLHTDSDAPHLSEPKARSRVAGHHHLSDHPDKTSHPKLNGPILVISNVLKNVMGSAAKAETAGLHHNCMEACPIRTTLEELGWPQPPTPVVTDNAVASGITTGAVKQKQSKAVDVRLCWVRTQVEQGQLWIHWKPGSANRADCFSKHHPPCHHQQERPAHSCEGDKSSTDHDPTSVRGCVDARESSQESLTVPHRDAAVPQRDGIRPQSQSVSTLR